MTAEAKASRIILAGPARQWPRWFAEHDPEGVAFEYPVID
jgi:hypothetical protein